MIPGSGSAGISRRYLYEEVADRIRTLIQSGELAPNSRISEPELVERFGISRTPLREALKLLAAERLIELLPNRGARVATISAEEIDEVLQVMAGVEAMAAELACSSITETEIDDIERRHEAMVAAWKSRDADAYRRLNRDIHDIIVDATRNDTLKGIYYNLSGRVRAMRFSSGKTDAQWRRSVDDHTRIVGFLRTRDAERLAALLKSHVREQRSTMLAAMAK